MRRLTSFFPALSLVLVLACSLGCAEDKSYISFEELTAGSRITDEYSSLGVRFVSDYVNPSTRYRSAPTIRVANSPYSAPNVMENDSSDSELWNSGGVPLVLLFAKPIRSVSFRIGCADCEIVPTATIRLLDCGGAVLSELIANSAMNFPTLVEVEDPSESTYAVVIDYGGSGVREAIDDLSFLLSSKTISCPGGIAPQVQITSHQDGQVVAGSMAIIEGTVMDATGYSSSFKINGTPVPLSPRSTTSGAPSYLFSHPMPLVPGMNPITARATNIAGKAGSDSITLNYGAPASFSLAEFHLTQRGVMQDLSGFNLGKCDIDHPLVAGKDAVIRVRLDVRTAEGAPTYVDQIEMRLFRISGPSETLVDTFYGHIYGAIAAGFNSPSEVAGIHFWIPGSALDPAGASQYRVEFQCYVQTNPVGPVLHPFCPFSNSFTVTETGPVKVLVVPAQVPLFDPILGEDHLADLGTMLAEVVRLYPVREGTSTVWSGEKSGLKLATTNPLQFCDGVSTSGFCKAGEDWKLIDTYTGSLLRAEHEQVLMSGTDCVGEHTLGGRLLTNTTAQGTVVRTVAYPPPGEAVSPIGYFRGGDHPKAQGFPGGPWMKYAIPLDDNHNGAIDVQDLQNFVIEFRDSRNNPSTWSTDVQAFSRILTQGETFRSFKDANGNFCNDESDFKADPLEPAAVTHHRWYNANAFVLPSARALLQQHNALNSNQFDFTYLLFSRMFNPDVGGFGFWGGGSSDGGTAAFVRVEPSSLMAHELGHNVGKFEDLYHAFFDDTGLPITDEDRQVPFWCAYAQGKQVNQAKIYEVMDATSPRPNEQFFNSAHYQALFNIQKAAAATMSMPSGDPREACIEVSGMVGWDGSLVSVTSRATKGASATDPDPLSRYELVIGDVTGDLLTHGIPLQTGHQFEGESEDVVPPPSFAVTVPVPPGAEWFEIREAGTTLWRIVRSDNAPRVTLLEPNGGESYRRQSRVRIRWTASDEDPRSRLTYSVFYQPGSGRPAIVLATGLTATELEWETSSVPGSDEAVITVVASDGLNLGQDTSDATFSLANKAPVVAIAAPRSGDRFLQWQSVPLRGVAVEIEGDSMVQNWFLDGVLVASRPAAQAPSPLAPGMHEARFEAIDPEGKSSSATVQFEVLADSDRDGMSDAYEEKWHLDPGNPADATADPDYDGVINFDEARLGTRPTFGTFSFSRTFYFAQVGDGADANLGLRTTMIFVNTGDLLSSATIEFFDSLGRPMALPIVGHATTSSLQISLDRGVSIAFETAGTGSLKVGYARVTATAGIGGTAVFSVSAQGTQLFEAGVPESPALNDFSFFVDSTAGKRRTGLALVNTGDHAADVVFRLYDDRFKPVASRRISDLLPLAFGAGMHLANYANEIFPEISQRGLARSLLTVESDQPLAAVTLRQWDDPAKAFPLDVPTTSAFPVIPGRADLAISPSPAGMFYFPQIADGSFSQPGREVVFSSTIILTNTNGDTSAKLEFFRSNGTPMAVSLDGLGVRSEYDIPLPRGTSYSARTSGLGGLQVGYARVTSSGQIGGTAVFTFRENGITMYESGVPGSQPLSQFTLFCDTKRPARDTGLALVNSGSSNAQATIRLYSPTFILLASRTLEAIAGGPFRPGDHLARFATEIFPEILDWGIEEAVISIESSEPLASVTLRQNDNPKLSFPAEVYSVTVFPVLPGRPTP